MSQVTARPKTVALMSLITAMLLIGGAGYVYAAQSAGRQHDGVILHGDAIHPAARVVRLNGSAGRLDTRTGELQRFRGNLKDSSGPARWAEFAPAVSERTSGVLDINQVQESTFLVDLVTGDTWLLRRTANAARWDHVDR